MSEDSLQQVMMMMMMVLMMMVVMICQRKPYSRKEKVLAKSIRFSTFWFVRNSGRVDVFAFRSQTGRFVFK